MKVPDVRIMAAPSVRRSFTTPGDIRSDVAFQNDINDLLSMFEEDQLPWKAVAALTSFGSRPRGVSQRRRSSVTPTLRVFDGRKTDPMPPAELTAPPPKREPVAARVRIRRGA
jgi:hypothetical protein